MFGPHPFEPRQRYDDRPPPGDWPPYGPFFTFILAVILLVAFLATAYAARAFPSPVSLPIKDYDRLLPWDGTGSGIGSR